MSKIVVVGIGTDVGKTVISAVLVEALKGEYWKPIQCGLKPKTDTQFISEWIPTATIHPSVYTFQTPSSPHFAAQIENITIQLKDFKVPKTLNPLIIEMAGGVLVPLNNQHLMIDLIKSWKDALCIVVSKHYLGSINHTLLTIEALKSRNISIKGFIFNGNPIFDNENIILKYTSLKCLGRIAHENPFNSYSVKKYASLITT